MRSRSSPGQRRGGASGILDDVDRRARARATGSTGVGCGAGIVVVRARLVRLGRERWNEVVVVVGRGSRAMVGGWRDVKGRRGKVGGEALL